MGGGSGLEAVCVLFLRCFGVSLFVDSLLLLVLTLLILIPMHMYVCHLAILSNYLSNQVYMMFDSRSLLFI